MDCHIRWMIRRDMPDVLRIEEQCFQWAAWTEQDFLDVLRQRSNIGIVAETDGVAGFAIYRGHKRYIDLLSIAIDPWWQRRGVGRKLVGKLIGKLHSRRPRLQLTVCESNLPAQLFFQALGLQAIDVYRDYYQDSHESAYLMQYDYQINTDQINVGRKPRTTTGM